MSLENATPTVVGFARFYNRPLCPHCTSEQLVPEQSEFAGEGRIRHTWICEPCGHEFRTAVEFGCIAA